MCMSENCNAEKELTKMAKDIGEIKSALLGNEFTDHKGIVHTVKQHAVEIDKLKKGMDYRTGFAAGIGAILGLAVGVLLKILS